MIPAGRPRVFTVPASVPFLPTLVAALRDGALVQGYAPRDPLDLARATLYLPTKRACRLAREAFLAAYGGDAVVLPRIVPLGNIDEDEFAFSETAGPAALDLPEAIGGFERQTLLAELILIWASSPRLRGAEGTPLVAQSPGAAFALAGDLARLMDDMTTRQVPWEKLSELVPDDFDRFWQYTLDFLRIAHEHWPGILAARGAIEPAERRDRLIAAEAARLAASPDAPVIAAGSTGSMPATAALIATIAKLPHGAVVLPGLDTDLDEESWDAIGGTKTVPPAAGHPQFALHGLLRRMELTRGDVATLGMPPAHGRERLVSEALRPAETTDRWPARLAGVTGLDGLTAIEAASAEEEALAIAVALREAVHEGKSAALVTPDRALARRVMAALERWRIAADDTGGDPLAASPAGVFARLAADVALSGFAPVPLLSLLKHPLLRLDAEAGAHHRGIAALERAVLRGPRPRAGSDGLKHALAAMRTAWDKLRRREESDLHAGDARALLAARDFDEAAAVVERLAAALASLEALGSRPQPFSAIAARHGEAVAALSRCRDGAVAFAGEDGAALAAVFEDIAAHGSRLAIAPADYKDLFEAAMAGSAAHPPGLPAAPVRIYGLLEARLTQADRVVLGGLVEGTWPPEVGRDPWLSRPMRHALGLNLPELRIGLTAHDFAQMLGAKEVILTRASRIAGAPTVASRFVQRLAAVSGDGWAAVAKRGETYLAWARGLDTPDAPPRPVPRPAVKPPREARPTTLSVTQIETLLRDPYAIYARHILDLRPLDAVDTPPGARDRGTVIHGAIAEFTETYKDGLPPDPVGELLRIGERHFAALNDFPEARAFWWPRFARIAHWFVTEFEAKRRPAIARLHAEIRGSLAIPLDGGRSFVLSARADRIERLADGRYAILDYKTGRVPGKREVRVGLAPQLTLESAILRNGGFRDFAGDISVAEIAYVSLRGGAEGGDLKAIEWPDTTPDAQADVAFGRLCGLMKRFDDEREPYNSQETPMFLRRGGGDYDHLARVKEWSLSGGGDDTGGGE